jgi:O-methyltransferase
VPGDLIETGVWRGGATIFMRGILAAYGDTTRTVWVADSFQGLPKPSGRYGADRNNILWRFPELAVGEAEVRANFARYDLLDDQVRFLKGLFQDTLREAPIEQLAVARLDGDMYESTIVALEALYPRLSVGGYLIVDDYGAFVPCRKAVDDYRREHGIDEPLVQIDWSGVYWQRQDPGR